MKFETPVVEVIQLEMDDIVTASGCPMDCPIDCPFECKNKCNDVS